MDGRRTKSLDVIALLRGLQSDAATQGGQVIITMGNHEAEFLADPLGKKTKEFSSQLQAAGIDPIEGANCVGDVGQFLCGLPISARVSSSAMVEILIIGPLRNSPPTLKPDSAHKGSLPRNWSETNPFWKRVSTMTARPDYHGSTPENPIPIHKNFLLSMPGSSE